MFEYTTILVKIEDRIATITFNRPESANAYTPATNQELRDALEQLGEREDVGCIVITGEGKHFSAGGDIYRMKRQIEEKVYIPKSGTLQDGMLGYAIRKCGKPVISMINGAAAGAGASIAAASDFRIMTEKSKIIMSFVKMGLTGDTGSFYYLYKLVGAAKMTEMIMLGEVLRGKEAFELGIAQLAPEGQLAEVTYELARKLAAMPTYAIKRIKENILQTIYSDIPRLTYMEADAMYDSSRTGDFEEAVNAFIEKRDPVFTGK
jgi:2-(1,2-epoxy-1,2-dihydrophenyl)acetyl-CoA isomerase